MTDREGTIIYSIGYQGVSQQVYIEALINSGVGVVIDVREHPWSQRREFIKSSMQKALAASGIDYVHVRSAGNPKANRDSASTISECLDRYRAYLAQNDSCLAELSDIIKSANQIGTQACLTCYEHLPEECHRGIILESLAIQQALRIIHLKPQAPSKKTIKKADLLFALDTTDQQL